MRWLFLVLLAALFYSNNYAQQITAVHRIKPDKSKNITVKNLNHNKNASTFLVWVQDSVGAHKHIHHQEIVYILKGKGIFNLGEKSFKTKKGDAVVIPKNTYHSVHVNSRKAMQVLSIQSPYFDGTDRHFKKNIKNSQ